MNLDWTEPEHKPHPDLRGKFEQWIKKIIHSPAKSTQGSKEISSPPIPPAKLDPAPQPSEAMLAQIGRKLEDQRTRVSMTLENVETYTHIPAHYLKALEDGKMQDLPSPVQGRGMLSNYAAFLDLDVDTILLEYAESLQLRREELDHEVSSDKKKRKPPKVSKTGSFRMVFSFDVVLVAFLLLAAFAALIWGMGNILSFRSDNAIVSTERPISDVIIATEISPTSEATVATLTLTPEPSQITMEGVNVETTLTLEISPTLSGIAPTVESGSIQVFIVASQRSFLKVVVDGKIAFNGRTIPGNPYMYTGNKQIDVLSGNAAGIQVTYNGQNLGTLGVNGAVIHLIFGPDSIGTPTLTPTSTFTETLRPSRTPRPSNTYPPTRTKTSTATRLPTSTPRPTHTPIGTVNP